MEITAKMIESQLETHFEKIMENVFTSYGSPVKDAVEELFRSDEIKELIKVKIGEALTKMLDDDKFGEKLQETLLLETIKNLARDR